LNQIDDLFDRMDAWRRLPSYQLERRADLFFSLYLAEAIEARYGFPVNSQILPEFPVRIGAIQPGSGSNQSVKIDYLVLSRGGDTAVLVELKTEGRSRRDEQDRYLQAAQAAGLPALVEGVVDIFRATNAKRKYFYLLEYLESMGLIRMPAQLRDIMSSRDQRGATATLRHIQITAKAAKMLVLYLQPNGSGPDILSFAEFRAVVQKHDDPISRRFVQSLAEWASISAGEMPVRST
jgi:hypothetical protein